MLARARILELLGNTLLLAAGVLVLVTVIALPTAYLTTVTDLPARRLFTVLAVLPLAIPGYVLAYALQATGGQGPIYHLTSILFGKPLYFQRPSGYWAALVALSIYNTPYLYLNLRAAFQRLDPALEEAARSLGSRPRQVFFRVMLPQLLPGFLAGLLLVTLHVLGDFGVVSLMRYDTFSLSLYQEARFGGFASAAWPALTLVGLTVVLLALDWRLLRTLVLSRVARGTRRHRSPTPLERWRLPAAGLLSLLTLICVVLPVGTIVYWATQGGGGDFWDKWPDTLGNSVRASLPAALLATAMALALGYLSNRFPSRLTFGLERSAYLGYATPPLAFALGWVLAAIAASKALASVGLPGLYQTLPLLVFAYTLHFIAEALGPIRTGLTVATPRLEEASRSLGRGGISTFFSVTVPLLWTALAVSVALVFLSAMKELPLTILLSPLDFDTLAKVVWDRASEISYAEAAPYALTIVVTSSLFVGILLLRSDEAR